MWIGRLCSLLGPSIFGGNVDSSGKKKNFSRRSDQPWRITVTSTNFSAVDNSKKKEGTRRHGWQRPLGGMVKLNVDASFREETRSGATGATIRDKGFFIGATNQIILQVMDVETAEALALLRELQPAQKLGAIES